MYQGHLLLDVVNCKAQSCTWKNGNSNYLVTPEAVLQVQPSGSCSRTICAAIELAFDGRLHHCRHHHHFDQLPSKVLEGERTF